MATTKPAARPSTRAAKGSSNGSSNGSSKRANGSTNGRTGNFTVPGMSRDDGALTARTLQGRLTALIDLALTLKHIHWNVVGPDFIGVHQMLDPQVAGVQEMIDETAERIATLGGSPNGLPGHIVSQRSWDDYELGRALVAEHLGALDLVYAGVIEDHRSAIDELEEPDLVTQDLLVSQSGVLEKYQWFVRAHLESASGQLSTSGATTELTAARRAKAGASRANTGR
jgi:starvation-inducible DNA-binding protein